MSDLAKQSTEQTANIQTPQTHNAAPPTDGGNEPQMSASAKDSQTLSSDTTGQQPVSRPPEIECAEPAGHSQLASRLATGPKTELGKQRSSRNATKYGIFSQGVLVVDESPAQYRALLRGLREYFQPQGAAEEVLVEQLAELFWRKRRALRAESAEIAKATKFIEADNLRQLVFEARDRESSGEETGGMLHRCVNPVVMHRAIALLLRLRTGFKARGLDIEEDCRILHKLYGDFSFEDPPEGLPKEYILFGAAASLEPGQLNDLSLKPEDAREKAIKCVTAEIKRLKRHIRYVEEIEWRRRTYVGQTLLVPKQEVLERLLRYEAHLDRSIDRTLSQLERLQRMRLGYPLPPPVKVELSP